MNYFDNQQIIGNINEEDIINTEQFSKNTLPIELLIKMNMVFIIIFKKIILKVLNF